MRKEPRVRDELAARVQQALALPTKKEAEHIVNTVIESLETTLLNNLGTNGFTLKLGSFGKFSIRHKLGSRRKIPFTGPSATRDSVEPNRQLAGDSQRQTQNHSQNSIQRRFSYRMCSVEVFR
jgi:nucleoid DNA-binding protein